ncbi:uncharacterized protein CTHT_0015030 [Thermochaetoides thermophila DSM 1495]|jgi:hypothetical protein|uniref:Uncharacterized protein n=1 Tax=Chaetomium thermophilum (strain DSM 1495 / CBS 144.50 / IMI 039719) TaxID=759272 RepID=G0S1W1_CHATD|nr:hypothetical protein CTHT_0015030 [Thermochaetoides thermophila DSM 1495]EGS23021.1 hypothetical protein CTHT_0015030 [Thermochaetoides thermophila DSM 1495]
MISRHVNLRNLNAGDDLLEGWNFLDKRVIPEFGKPVEVKHPDYKILIDRHHEIFNAFSAATHNGNQLG